MNLSGKLTTIRKMSPIINGDQVKKNLNKFKNLTIVSTTTEFGQGKPYKRIAVTKMRPWHRTG
jgi:hypothetical protein